MTMDSELPTAQVESLPIGVRLQAGLLLGQVELSQFHYKTLMPQSLSWSSRNKKHICEKTDVQKVCGDLKIT